MPGVSAVGLSSMPLLKGYGWQNAVLGENFSERQSRSSPSSVKWGRTISSRSVFPSSKREFTDQDRGPQKYAVINQSFAKRYLPRRSIGRRFGLVDDQDPAHQPDIQVVGVISDTKYRDMRETLRRRPTSLYFQGASFRFYDVYLRTHGDRVCSESQIQERMRQFDPHVPIVMQTMGRQIAGRSNGASGSQSLRGFSVAWPCCSLSLGSTVLLAIPYRAGTGSRYPHCLARRDRDHRKVILRLVMVLQLSLSSRGWRSLWANLIRNSYRTEPA